MIYVETKKLKIVVLWRVKKNSLKEHPLSSFSLTWGGGRVIGNKGFLVLKKCSVVKKRYCRKNCRKQYLYLFQVITWGHYRPKWLLSDHIEDDENYWSLPSLKLEKRWQNDSASHSDAGSVLLVMFGKLFPKNFGVKQTSKLGKNQIKIIEENSPGTIDSNFIIIHNE